MSNQNNGVTIYKSDSIFIPNVNTNVSTEINGKWVAARSHGFADIPHRLKCVWLVWTGRADLIVWPGQ